MHGIGTRAGDQNELVYGLEMSVMVVSGDRQSSDSDSSSRGIIRVEYRVDVTEGIMT